MRNKEKRPNLQQEMGDIFNPVTFSMKSRDLSCAILCCLAIFQFILTVFSIIYPIQKDYIDMAFIGPTQKSLSAAAAPFCK